MRLFLPAVCVWGSTHGVGHHPAAADQGEGGHGDPPQMCKWNRQPSVHSPACQSVAD